MSIAELRWHPTRRELRQFALVWFPLFWVLLAGLCGWRLERPYLALFAAALAAASMVVGFARPGGMLLCYRAWMTAGFAAGWLVTGVLLTAVFFGVMTPVGLLLRLMRRDPLSRRFDAEATTYWVARSEQPETADYFRQF